MKKRRRESLVCILSPWAKYLTNTLLFWDVNNLGLDRKEISGPVFICNYVLNRVVYKKGLGVRGMKNEIRKPNISKKLEVIDILDRNLEDEDYFDNILFNQCDLSSQRADRVEFTGCVFRNTSFERANLYRVDFIDCRFESCNLSNADLSSSSIHKVEFINCKLIGVNFDDSSIENVSVVDSNGDYGNFSMAGIKNVEFIDSTLNDASFEECIFSNARFSNINMRRVTIYKAKMKNIDFSTCDIDGIIGEFKDFNGLIVNQMQAISISKILGLVIKE